MEDKEGQEQKGEGTCPTYIDKDGTYNDRYGRKVFPFVVKQLKGIGQRLETLGFSESKNKPFLWSRKLGTYGGVGDVKLYADLRGTDVVPIWEDICPLVYVFFNREYSYDWDDSSEKMTWHKYEGLGNTPSRTKEIIEKVAVDWLELNGISARQSTIHMMEHVVDSMIEFEGSPAYRLLEDYKKELSERIHVEEASYKEMVADFDEYLASVKEFIKPDYWKACRICRAQDMLHAHHISYEPEVVIPLCPKCHKQVHDTNKYPHLKAEKRRKEWVKKKTVE